MQNYRRHIEEHLLPAFEDSAVADILSTDIAAWEKHERAVPYAASSVKTWRATLHLILADAVDEGLRDSNPATKRRGRGKRAGRSRNRGPEKAVTTALGILLLAERHGAAVRPRRRVRCRHHQGLHRHALGRDRWP